MASEPEGVAVLKEVVCFLEARGIRYWLGRGRFRHFTLKHEFGRADADIDFHLLRQDEGSLRGALHALEASGYTVTDSSSRHKVSVQKGPVDVEFVYLDQAPDDESALYHETVYPLRKRFVCPVQVFGERRMDIFGASVRVPDEEYLCCVFGPRWRENVKGAGGVQI